MNRVLTILIFIFFSNVAMCGAAFAVEDRVAQKAEWFKDQAELHQDLFLVASVPLKAHPPSEWDDQQLLSYLSNSFMAVYSAVSDYECDKDGLPSDPQALIDEQYLEHWPENPFDNWEPMELSTSAGFSAGNFYIQYCPPEYYSTGDTGLIPFSFNICLFGPDIAYSEFFGSHFEPLGENEDWMVVPEGSLFSANVHLSASTMLKEQHGRQ